MVPQTAWAQTQVLNTDTVIRDGHQQSFVCLFEMTAARGAELIMFIVSRGVWGGGHPSKELQQKRGLGLGPPKKRARLLSLVSSDINDDGNCFSTANLKA